MLEGGKSFYIETPSENGNLGSFIFDDLYKNARQKNRFEKNPNFKYFNMITRMKNQFGHKRKDLYKKIFNPMIDFTQKNDKRIQSFRSVQVPNPEDKKTFHVEKLNKRSFKIYKDKKASFFENNDQAPSINDINFQVHFKTEKPVGNQKKPQIKTVIAEYEKIKNKKRGITTPRAKTTARSARSNMTQNLQIATSTIYKKPNHSIIKIV